MSLRPPWADRRALNASLRTTCSCALLEGTRLAFGPSPSRLLRSLQPGPEELSCRTRWSTKTIQRRSPRTLHVTAPPDPTRPAPNTATESPPPRRPLVRLSPGKSVDVCGMHQLDHSIFVPTSTPHLTTTVRTNVPRMVTGASHGRDAFMRRALIGWCGASTSAVRASTSAVRRSGGLARGAFAGSWRPRPCSGRTCAVARAPRTAAAVTGRSRNPAAVALWRGGWTRGDAASPWHAGGARGPSCRRSSPRTSCGGHKGTRGCPRRARAS